ncbi:hypothetical protein TorRG33x02_066880 [Trema orientale]|uniref:Uncharacterized protein n=1 Tax=Trema orientale TaxID=63057 RepID=A0A2P5FI90_TREOI|nr:hypothetical protein TorRG33x02_066880 [Trema orientale]
MQFQQRLMGAKHVFNIISSRFSTLFFDPFSSSITIEQVSLRPDRKLEAYFTSFCEELSCYCLVWKQGKPYSSISAFFSWNVPSKTSHCSLYPARAVAVDVNFLAFWLIR